MTVQHPAPPDHARLKTYRDVLEAYATHPEPNSADSSGETCSVETRELLYRQHVHSLGVQFIGKESNELEAVEKGLVHDRDEVQASYGDPGDRYWTEEIIPRLERLPREFVAEKVGCSREWVSKVLNRREEPSPELREKLAWVAMTVGS